MTTLHIERGDSPATPGPGDFLCGVEEVDITPHPGFPLAGFSTQAKDAEGVCGHLFARVLYLRDQDGEDAAIVVMDMHAGSRLLLEKIAHRTRTSCNLGIDRILLHGTHTHGGPAWFYGNSVYDFFAGGSAGFDEALVDWLAGRIASAIERAHASAGAGGVAFAESTLSGVSRNRSIEAFHANAARMSSDERHEWLEHGPWANPGAGLHEHQQFIDPRILTLVAVREEDARPLAVFAFFACHPTARGADSDVYSADWPGRAGRAVRTLLHEENPEWQPIVAVGMRAGGDINCHRYGLGDVDPLAPGPALEASVGDAVGTKIAEAAIPAVANASAVEITPWFGEPRIDDVAWQQARNVPLAQRWYFGAPTATGSEETDTGLLEWFVNEGAPGTHFPREDPQFPKRRFLGLGQNLLQELFSLDTAPVHMLFALRLGDTLLVGLPGEPTIGAGYTIERDLLAATGCTRGAVLPCCGDYAGYLATTAEYMEQHYEGSSTLYGRNSADYLRKRLLDMVANSPVPAQARTVTFNTVDDENDFVAQDSIRYIDPRPRLKTYTARKLIFEWKMHRDARVVFGNSPWVRLTTKVGDVWEDVLEAGRPVDDRSYPVTLRRADSSGFPTIWTAQLPVPTGYAGRPLRIAVSPRDEFRGFVLDVWTD